MMSTARLTRWALLALVLADSVLLAGRAWAAGQLPSARAPFARTPFSAPLPSGFLAVGTAYEPPARFRCALVQYTSSHCSTAAIRFPRRGSWPLPSAVRAASWL